MESNAPAGLAWFSVLLVPLVAVVWTAWRRHAFPAHRVAYLLAIPCGVSVLGTLAPALAAALGSTPIPPTGDLTYLLVLGQVIVDLLVLGILWLDVVVIDRLQNLQIGRTITPVQSLAVKSHVLVQLANLGTKPLRLRIRDDIPDPFTADPRTFDLLLPPQVRAELNYTVSPQRRGRFQFECLHVRVGSRWGFWHGYHRLPLAAEVRVYPDLKQIREYELLARTNRLSQLGLKRARRVGQDHDFERLREFTRDDNYKHIDWRATARRQRLMVKDFQTSRNQRVVFMLDCGRMMMNESSGLTLFDHTINASLMLAHIALSRGDAVGMLVFSDRIHGYIPPRSGMQQMNHFLHALFDRFPQMVESAYDEAFLYLTAHCRRRSLVVMISNVIDEVNGSRIRGYLGSLAGQHLPLGVLLRDPRIFQFLTPPTSPLGATHPASVATGVDPIYTTAAAAEIVHWRHQVLVALRKKGVLMLDVFPDQITAPLINQYLDIKARHLL